MYKAIKAFLTCLLFFSIYFSSAQIGNNNDIFANSMAYCCNAGYCHDISCAFPSSIRPCTGSEYIRTCEWCIPVVSSLRGCNLYNGAWPTWCILDDGTKYYGD